jgi:hypothetical protein
VSVAIRVQAVVESVQSALGSRGGESIRVMARYESAGTIGSLTFDAPLERAADFYVGRTLALTVDLVS